MTRTSSRALLTQTSMLAAKVVAAAVLACSTAQASPQPVLPPAAAAAERPLDASLNQFLDQASAAQSRLSPQQPGDEADPANNSKLNDYTPAAGKRRLALLETQVREMEQRFDRAQLGVQGRISYDLFKRSLDEARMEDRWRGNRYVFTALGAPTTDLPTFFVNNHRVTSVADAEAYISRLREVERVMREVTDTHRDNISRGVIEPKFIFAPAITVARKVIGGAPFDNGPDSVLWADFKAKLNAIEVDPTTKARLLSEASDALRGPVRRGYEMAFASLEAASRKATTNDGVWRLPNGRDYYAWTVRRATTTNLTPDEVHAIGLEKLRKAQAEMTSVARSLGGKGTLREFLAGMRVDPRFRYPNTEAGREQYLADARAVIVDVERVAPAYFGEIPRAPLEVRAVEKWRQDTAPVAFYDGAGSGSNRVGLYYVNLRDLTQVMKTSLTGITCHEAVPGHHFQGIFAKEAKDLPTFRRRAGYAAYGEGWGLYSEQLCKEMGVYKDGYSLFSRLSGDARRAARLVVDTGVNAKGWSRERALTFLKENTLMSDDDAESEVNRYLTSPGQATSYMIGQRKIVELRQKATAELGPAFDIREFHRALLGSGSLPLDVLEERIDAYIADRKSAAKAQRGG